MRGAKGHGRPLLLHLPLIIHQPHRVCDGEASKVLCHQIHTREPGSRAGDKGPSSLLPQVGNEQKTQTQLGTCHLCLGTGRDREEPVTLLVIWVEKAPSHHQCHPGSACGCRHSPPVSSCDPLVGLRFTPGVAEMSLEC